MDGNARQHRFDKNAGGSNWQLTVHAANKIGAGPASDPVSLQTGGVPLAAGGRPGMFLKHKIAPHESCNQLTIFESDFFSVLYAGTGH